MNLLKLNRQYSIIIFFFNILVIFSVSKFLEIKNITIPYQTVICFFLISIIGVCHGALDHVKGSQLMKIYKVKNNFYFYLVYIFLSLLVILCWTILPLFTLIIFLLVASYHFGKEDSSVGLINNSGFKNILYLFKGSLIVVAPLFFHQEETLKIFQSLDVDIITTNENLIIFFLIISFSANIILMSQLNYNSFLLADWLTILLLNIFLSPLVAFTLYFCFLHSVRHSFSLIYEIDKKNFKNGVVKFIKKAVPLTVITAILFIIAIFFLTNYYVLDEAILKVIFIGLASLTFPHILLEYLIEKNEK